MSAFVYRAFNAEGVLLYIGSTIGPAWRMKAHESHTRWWHVAARFDFEQFDTEAEAREAEIEAIRTEFPRWNIRHRADDHPDGRATTYLHILANYPDDCRWGMGRSALVQNVRRRRAA